jgi:serine/threonine protein phosphatase PrpC
VSYQLAHYSLRGARPVNEDRVAVAERSNAALLAVADGLGGHAGGEIAAELLIESALRAFRAVRQPLITRPSAFLALTILQAHQAIRARAKADPAQIEPRTTCALCLVQSGYAYWAHVGDSRLYHFRDGRLLSRTHDHSAIEQLREDGVLSDSEMAAHPSKGRLLKCVGGPNKPTIALGPETRLARGDTLLLCSDGLWEALTPEEIAGHLAGPQLEAGVEELLLAAERRMREHCDNVTVAALRWLDKPTTSLPLQANEAVQVDPDRLWQDGTEWSAGRRREQRRAPPGAEPGDKAALERQIRELEDYLRRFEPKR